MRTYEKEFNEIRNSVRLFFLAKRKVSNWHNLIAQVTLRHLKPSYTENSLFIFSVYALFPDLASGWCELAYWELNERVGCKVPVEESAFDIFTEQTRGAGLCIRTLAQQRSTRTPDTVLKTRDKIGLGELIINAFSQSIQLICFLLLGVTLSRELDGVWLYNRSSSAVFVHSPTLCDSRTTTVHKVPPGHCLRAFDPLK